MSETWQEHTIQFKNAINTRTNLSRLNTVHNCLDTNVLKTTAEHHRPTRVKILSRSTISHYINLETGDETSVQNFTTTSGTLHCKETGKQYWQVTSVTRSHERGHKSLGPIRATGQKVRDNHYMLSTGPPYCTWPQLFYLLQQAWFTYILVKLHCVLSYCPDISKVIKST